MKNDIEIGLSKKDINKLLNTTIISLAEQLHCDIKNDIVHENTSIYEYIKNYLNE